MIRDYAVDSSAEGRAPFTAASTNANTEPLSRKCWPDSRATPIAAEKSVMGLWAPALHVHVVNIGAARVLYYDNTRGCFTLRKRRLASNLWCRRRCALTKSPQNVG